MAFVIHNRVRSPRPNQDQTVRRGSYGLGTLIVSKSGRSVLRRALWREPGGEEWTHTGPAPSPVSRVWESHRLDLRNPLFRFGACPGAVCIGHSCLRGRPCDPGDRADHPGYQETVCTWLDRAAQQCRLVILSLWPQLPLSECQWDALWSCVPTKDAHLAWAKPYRDTSGDAWVWVAVAPEWRLVVAFVVGKRTQADANLLLKRVAHGTTDLIPLFTSDQLPAYRTALLPVDG